MLISGVVNSKKVAPVIIDRGDIICCRYVRCQSDRLSLSAFGGAAGGADEASFLVDECLLAAVGAALAFGSGAVGQIFL